MARLQGLRGTYGIQAPAPICDDPAGALSLLEGGDPATCQIVQAPEGGGQRLVADVGGAERRQTTPPADGEIRLTYRELSALIEDAIRSLR